MDKNTLKRRLIKIRGHKCEKCGLTEWLGVTIPIQIHHVDGDRHNNTIDNGQLLCPNCHALTDNFSGKNIRTRLDPLEKNEEIKRVAPQCHSVRDVLNRVGLCGSIPNYDRVNRIMREFGISFTTRVPSDKDIERRLKSRRVVRPIKSELEHLVWTIPTSAVATKYGVSDKAVSKWCMFYGISKPPRGYWSKQRLVTSEGVEPSPR